MENTAKHYLFVNGKKISECIPCKLEKNPKLTFDRDFVKNEIVTSLKKPQKMKKNLLYDIETLIDEWNDINEGRYEDKEIKKTEDELIKKMEIFLLECKKNK